MKIAVNDSFRSAALKRYFANLSNGADGVSIKMFDGTMPTYEEIQAMGDIAGYNSDGTLAAGNLLTELGNAGYTTLFDIEYKNLTERRQTTYTSIDFFLSQRTESAFGLTDGQTATWFWMYQHNDNAPTGWSFWNLFGSVGLVDSGSDIELVDNVISTTQSYKINDINLNFNINPTTLAEPEPETDPEPEV